MKSRTPLLVFLLCLLVSGCGRKERVRAMGRVIEAMSAKSVLVTSNQYAVLRLPKGYAAITFSNLTPASPVVGQTSTFKVFVSESGHFNSDQPTVIEGLEVPFEKSNILVEGTSILVGGW